MVCRYQPGNDRIINVRAYTGKDARCGFSLSKDITAFAACSLVRQSQLLLNHVGG